MIEWRRETPFEQRPEQTETWICREDGDEQRFDVHVTLGKPVDILSLKLNMTEDYARHVDACRRSREALYGGGPLETLKTCPICASPSHGLPPVLTVYHARYIQCPGCGHYYVPARPGRAALDAFYAGDRNYQSTYADPRTTQTRIEQVALPKARWVTAQYERLYGRKPESLLDVGAGSGHFVKACRDLGYRADGVELSEFGRSFAKDNFGIAIINKDFIAEWESLTGYEVITFWGVIEHVPQPLAMLEAARRSLERLESGQGLVAAEVPRWDCLGTAVQAYFASTVVRHLDPLGHINVFSDRSLATAFRRAGFRVDAAWYFGMDAYELVTQTAHALGEDRALEILGPAIPGWQEQVDRAKLADEMVFAGRP